MPARTAPPARAWRRLAGATAFAPVVVCAVLLAHDAKEDTLTAYATLGGELFDDFFRKYEARLSLEMGSRARNAAGKEAVVRELEKFCRNPIQC